MQSLEGKVALVTGASRGLGAVTAGALAAAGARIVITHRDSAAAAEQVCASLAGKGHRIVQASVLESEALTRAARSVAETEGRLDILVNNAGVTKFVPHGDLDGLDDDTFDLIMRTNVRGAFACARAFQPLLAADGGGLIVNITSIAGRTAFGSNVAYCASKAALDNITMSLARALAPDIRVVSVSPGLVDTELSRSWDPAVRQHQIDATPLGRLANPDEVGRAVLAVATTLDFTNGSIITVDGGRPLGT